MSTSLPWSLGNGSDSGFWILLKSPSMSSRLWRTFATRIGGACLLAFGRCSPGRGVPALVAWHGPVRSESSPGCGWDPVGSAHVGAALPPCLNVVLRAPHLPCYYSNTSPACFILPFRPFLIVDVALAAFPLLTERNIMSQYVSVRLCDLGSSCPYQDSEELICSQMCSRTSSCPPGPTSASFTAA